MIDRYLPSAGGGQIHACIWEPEKTPKGIVQLVHGIAEHVHRYDDFAEFLAAKGYLVAAEDHMGHSGSISEKTPQGCFSGGWLAAVADVNALKELMQKEHPDLPYVLMGHSMGSFLARTYLYTYPDAGLRAAILSGTAWQPAPVLTMGQMMCRREAKRVGEQNPSVTLMNLMFGSYSKRFGKDASPNAWISSVPEQVSRYEADPLCGFAASSGLCRDMLSGIAMNQRRENLEAMPKDLPILFLSGDEDPVGSFGKGVRAAYEAFRKAGMQDVSLRLYPGGRHEMLHEKDAESVKADLLAWIESKTQQ